MSNEQMISMIECFLHHKVNRNIRIAKPRTPQQYMLLVKAYENCKDFFIKH